jgi:hypothetical protein
VGCGDGGCGEDGRRRWWLWGGSAAMKIGEEGERNKHSFSPVCSTTIEIFVKHVYYNNQIAC